MRSITKHEMERKRLRAAAKGRILAAMENDDELTAIEWIGIFQDIQNRLLDTAQADEIITDRAAVMNHSE